MGKNHFRHALSTLALASATLSAACSGTAPTAPTTPAEPAASASPIASTAPQPSASVTPGATAAPSTAVEGETGTMRGKVFDENLAAVPDGSTVRVKSLDPARPFETTVETREGTYVVNGAPVGSALEISATRSGWTHRTRVEVLRRTTAASVDTRNIFNFGGMLDEKDPAGSAYFLADYPEIETVEPADEATSLPNDRMRLKLVVSEPLDTANQRRLASALLIIPNNQESLGDDVALPAATSTGVEPADPEALSTSAELAGLRGGSAPATTSAYRYRQNSGFLNGAVLSEFKWEADGRTATFTLQAPVKTGDSDEGEYAFMLVQADEDPIQDAQGKPLGQNAAGDFGRTMRNEIIYNAVKEADLSLVAGRIYTPKQRWSETHVSYTSFKVATDTIKPKVVSVNARRNYVDDDGEASDRIEIAFNEPMIAYPRIASRQLLSMDNYIIAAAATQEALDALTLDDDGSAGDIKPGDPIEDVRKAIGGPAGATVATNSASAAGNYSISLSVNDPKVVIINLPGGALPLEAEFIKVLVGADTSTASSGTSRAVTDPAGNVIDVNQRTASGSIF